MSPAELESIFGHFRGLQIPPLRAEALMVTGTGRGLIERVPELYDSMWFGYRTVPPGILLCIFADRYYKAWSHAAKMFRKSVSRFRSNKKKIVFGDCVLICGRAQIVAAYKAKMIADLFGIPYDFYCREYMRIALERGWPYPPTIVQMYNEAIYSKVVHIWEEKKRETLFRTKNPAFSADNYVGHKWQDAYIKHLVVSLKIIGSKTLIKDCVYDNPQIPEYIAKQYGLV